MNIHNKKFIRIIFFFLLFILISSCQNKEKINPKAYITNQGDNTVSIVDLKNLEVIKTLEVEMEETETSKIFEK